VPTRRFPTKSAAIEGAYRALLEVEGRPVKDGFRRLDENPAEFVAGKLGWSVSRARQVLRLLKGEDLFHHSRVGNDFYWLVKLPDDGAVAQQQLDVDGVDEMQTILSNGWFSDLDRLVNQIGVVLPAVRDEAKNFVLDKVQLKARIAALEAEIDALRERNALLEDKAAQLDNAVKVLGSLDVDLVRAIIESREPAQGK
jgi:hypothetical protein